MRKYFLFVLFCMCASLSFADLLRVGLFYGRAVTSAEFVVGDEGYSIVLSSGRNEDFPAGHIVTVSAAGNLCRVIKNDKPVGSFSKVKFVSLLADGTLRIKLQGPEPNLFTYGGQFEISSVKGRLRIVNLTDLESYVAAVVESEIGANSNLEFLKVQSVLCRTYCLSHLGRHAHDGYQLCDQVHCQTYKGKNRFNKRVEEAVLSTSNKVLADYANNLIIGAYHSNCGGQTLSADSVWSRHAEYLLPVTDTFCISSQHATWIFTAGLNAWKNFLKEKGLIDQEADSLMPDSLFNYMPTGRSSSFILNGKKLPLKTIRELWKMNSTWFSIRVNGDSVHFTGRGFGHGIGLCQEGAMQMAESGKTFSEIIDFYFHKVKLADADALILLKGKF